MHSKKKRDFQTIRSIKNIDILDDIHLILRNLKNAGFEKVIMVNLTDSEIGIPVVRIIVPGLETFKVTKGIIGMRGRRYFPSIKEGELD